MAQSSSIVHTTIAPSGDGVQPQPGRVGRCGDAPSEAFNHDGDNGHRGAGSDWCYHGSHYHSPQTMIIIAIVITLSMIDHLSLSSKRERDASLSTYFSRVRRILRK